MIRYDVDTEILRLFFRNLVAFFFFKFPRLVFKDGIYFFDDDIVKIVCNI